MGSFQTPEVRFDKVHLDLVGPLAPSRGFVYLLTVIDRFTRWPEAIPLVDSTADTIARAFVAHWVSRFGVPSTITTDQGRQFESNLWRQLMGLLGSHRIRTTAYHPCSNGLVERFHRQLKGSLKASLPTTWVDALPLVMLGIRSALKDDLHATAAELVYGATLRVPGEFFTSTLDEAVPNAAEYVIQLRNAFRTLQAVPTRAQQRKVFVHTDLLTSTHVFIRHDAVRTPLQPPYDGPYKVRSRSDKTYTVDRDGRDYVVSVDRLKPAYLEYDSVSSGEVPSSSIDDSVASTSPSPLTPTSSTSLTATVPSTDARVATPRRPASSLQDRFPTRISRAGRHIRWPDKLDI